MSRCKLEKEMGKERVAVLRKLGMPEHHPKQKLAKPKRYGFSVQVKHWKNGWDDVRHTTWFETARARDQAMAHQIKDRMYEGSAANKKLGDRWSYYRDARKEQR